MNRRILGVIGAVALAVLGTAVLVTFVNRAEDRALEGEKTVKVWVVRNTIPAGTAANDIAGSVEQEKVPAKVRAQGAVTKLSELEERVARSDLLPGEQVVEDRFVEPRDYDSTPSRIGVPEGMLEVTVALEPEKALGGLVRPGDRVAVLSSFEPFDITGGSIDVNGQLVPLPAELSSGAGAKTPNATHLILHKVLVTEVQVLDQNGDGTIDPSAEADSASTDIKDPAAATEGRVYVTLAVDAASVERIVFTAEYGMVYLANEPSDANEEGTSVQTRGSIFNETAPSGGGV